jgi:hypothetical protein
MTWRATSARPYPRVRRRVLSGDVGRAWQMLLKTSVKHIFSFEPLFLELNDIL